MATLPPRATDETYSRYPYLATHTHRAFSRTAGHPGKAAALVVYMIVLHLTTIVIGKLHSSCTRPDGRPSRETGSAGGLQDSRTFFNDHRGRPTPPVYSLGRQAIQRTSRDGGLLGSRTRINYHVWLLIHGYMCPGGSTITEKTSSAGGLHTASYSCISTIS